MAGPANAGVVIYAKGLDALAQFYTLALGLSCVHETADLRVLGGADWQIVLHAIPPAIAQRMEITRPPQRRENVALKFFATVPSLAQASEQVQRLGGEMWGERWQGASFTVCNATDPEGNVFQLREMA